MRVARINPSRVLRGTRWEQLLQLLTRSSSSLASLSLDDPYKLCVVVDLGREADLTVGLRLGSFYPLLSLQSKYNAWHTARVNTSLWKELVFLGVDGLL